jgi:Tol biopolymer transport system component
MKLMPILAAGVAVAAVALMAAPPPALVYSVELAKPSVPPNPPSQQVKSDPREKHIRNVRQLTFNGDNAEAYFSFDGKSITFQSTRAPFKCDQIFHMGLDGTNLQLISTGKGRTTCSYFMPDGKRIIYASTHLTSPDCPPPADKSKGYVWAVYPSFKIFSAKPDGTDLKQLTFAPGYNAEATVAPNGKKIVFTSSRDGDLELYDMDPDGSHQRRLTHALGYDGGAWHSHDSQWIVWRANRPTTPAEVTEYKDLIAQNLVKPEKMELWVMRADGSEQKQITHFGGANFAPYFFPGDKKIIFASNMKDPKGGNFDLFSVNRDGSGLEQLTFDEGFDGFPMFTEDGKKIIWESSRNSGSAYATNVFIADWIDTPK